VFWQHEYGDAAEQAHAYAAQARLAEETRDEH
jgi:hypothetical protein